MQTCDLGPCIQQGKSGISHVRWLGPLSEGHEGLEAPAGPTGIRGHRDSRPYTPEWPLPTSPTSPSPAVLLLPHTLQTRGHSPCPWLGLVTFTHAVSRPGPVVCSPHSRLVSPCRSWPEGPLLREALPDSEGHRFASPHHQLVPTCVHSLVSLVTCLPHH